MNTELALKVNKYIHEQCIDGVPHDIGWNVVKLFCQPAVVGQIEQLVCDNHRADLEHFLIYSESICKNCKQKV